VARQEARDRRVDRDERVVRDEGEQDRDGCGERGRDRLPAAGAPARRA
jgi:hypothetical protein